MKLLRSLLFAVGITGTAQASDVHADGLHGLRPATPQAIPEFQVLNRDGAARGPADLRGHPTVLWFYPAAGTPV